MVLERPQAPIEHPRDGQGLVRRDLADGQGGERRVERRHHVAGMGVRRQSKGDRTAARSRAEQTEHEARRHRIAGFCLVDDHPGDRAVFARRERRTKRPAFIAVSVII